MIVVPTEASNDMGLAHTLEHLVFLVVYLLYNYFPLTYLYFLYIRVANQYHIEDILIFLQIDVLQLEPMVLNLK